MQSVNNCSSVLQQTGQTMAAPRNGWAGTQGWVLLTAHFLSALSPCLGKGPQIQHDWLDACSLLTCQNDFSDILTSPGGTNDFWKAAMSFPLFFSKLPWVLIWTSSRSMPKFSTSVLHCLEESRLKTGISFCKKTRHTGSKILSIPIFLCTVITSADVFQNINSGCLPGERCGSSCNAFNQLRTKAFVLANVQIKYLPPPSTLKYFKKRRALI